MSFWAKCTVNVLYRRFNVAVGLQNPLTFSRLCSTMNVVQKAQKEVINADMETVEKFCEQGNNSVNIRQFLYERFLEEKNCYAYALNLLALAPAENRTKLSQLAFEVIVALNDWVKENNVTETVTVDLKQKALQTVFDMRIDSLLCLVCDLFQIRQHKEELKEVAEKLIDVGKIDEAALCIASLGLQKSYPLEQIVVPLLLERKHFSILMKYLKGHPDLQVELVKWLDNWIADLHNNPELKMRGRRVSPHFLYRVLDSVMKNFNLSPSLCPNASKVEVGGTLNMLIRKKLERSIAESAWEGIIESAVQNDLDLQKALLKKLVFHNDVKTALKMAEKFNIAKSDWPDVLLNKEDISIESQQATQEIEEKQIIVDPCSDYLSLDLDSSHIQFVVSREEFLRCLEDISQPGRIVGIDSEWRPHCRQEATRLSLVQLAVTNQVYILDMLALETCLLREHWDSFMEKFLANPCVLKLGCGVTQDVQMLTEGHKGNRDKPIKFSHVLDMAILYQKMDKLYDDVTCTDAPSSNVKGLSALCCITLGQPLNKEERACDWEVRPLSHKQITYAALDAYCLLLMLESMKMHAKEKGKNFSYFLNLALSATTCLSKIAVKNKKNLKWVRVDQYSFSFRKRKAVNDFKVIIDSELKDVGLSLRMYGADVTFQNSSDIMKDNFKAINDGNVVIGSPMFHEKVKGLLPQEKYFIVRQNEGDAKNTVALIFEYFNVRVSIKSIFSRCMCCNGSQFQEVLSDELQSLWSAHSKTESKKLEDSLTGNTNELTASQEHLENSFSVIIDSKNVKVNMQSVTPEIFSKSKFLKICTNCGNVQCQR